MYINYFRAITFGKINFIIFLVIFAWNSIYLKRKASYKRLRDLERWAEGNTCNWIILNNILEYLKGMIFGNSQVSESAAVVPLILQLREIKKKYIFYLIRREKKKMKCTPIWDSFGTMPREKNRRKKKNNNICSRLLS